MSKEKEYYKVREASFGVAVIAAISAVFFIASMVFVRMFFPSAVYTVGGVLCALACIVRVVWKFVLAASGRDITFLRRQFPWVMLAGLVVMAVAVILARPSFSVIWKNISWFPGNYLFAVTAAGLVAAAILIANKRSLGRGESRIGQILNLIAQICLLLAVLIIWYASDSYRADTEQYQQSTDAVLVTEIQGGLFFNGVGTDTAIIFYPGAKVEYTAYAPLMMELAESGVDCFLLEMPYNLAVFGIDRAEDILSGYTYEHWYVAGHSLGGSMAASFAAGHTDELDGVILLASYATRSLDPLPVLSVYGSEDGVLNMENLEEARQYAADYTEICIDGGNHAGFGCYGEQDGDGTAWITQETQRKMTELEILEWISGT